MDVLIPNDISNGQLNRKNTKNARVTKLDGSSSFGKIPKLNDLFPEGEIFLKLGERGFYNSRLKILQGAFGLRHIWDRHRSEIGASNAEQIIVFIESVLKCGAEILIDENKYPNKPLVVESSSGMVVLELKRPQNENAYYTIITAYQRKSHPGTLMGQIK